MKKTKQIILSVALSFSLLGAATVEANGVQMNSPAFSDVPFDHWAQPAILWGVQQKITSGYEDGTFKPNKAVTEEEFVTLLVRAYGIETSTESKQRWSDSFYSVAADHNLPVSNDRTASITRQSVANIIVGTQGVNFMGGDAVQYMLAKGLTKGKTSATIEGYKGQDTLTRAEAITFIKNVMDKLENKTMLARPKEPTSKSELPSLPSSSEVVHPKDEEGGSASKQISLDFIISAFNKAVEEQGLPQEYILVKETFTPNTSDKTRIIYDYYATSPDGKIIDSFAFSVFYDAETGSLQNIQGTVNFDQAVQFMQCLFAVVYQDGEKANQVYSSYKIAEVIKKVYRDKTTIDGMKLDNGYRFRFGVLGNNPQIPNPKGFFSLYVQEEETLPAENAIGKKDPVLAQKATQVHTVVSEAGFRGGYNGDRGGIFVEDSEGYIILAHSDGRNSQDGTVTITLSSMMGAGKKVDQVKVQVVIDALKVLGVPADDKLAKAINQVLAPDGVEATVKYGDVNIELVSIAYGKLLMYID
ncbi:hypothetical protein PAECIP111893_05317 [Paenibacillus plantiphilus]|uniref:SLH domain-containing protein n=1 Tax=Paenibacillus plantiphilus TaxID=2905650 RepID=A0ABN8H329_9BACL|nr:S-layer homology domain-containing protein [Paenibacillus plantiphilus]CAH1226044.1 hypothetical protein PAECIP111893_05317 [Paenibacillus plantiphilus]